MPQFRPRDDDDDDDDDFAADDDEYEVEAGDFLEHNRFGRCSVLNSDGERVTVRMENGRVAELHLSVLTLNLTKDREEEEGPRTFTVAIRRRR